jgi:beta-glucosidase
MSKAPGVLMVAALLCPATTWAKAAVQPQIVARAAPVITVQGLRFKDLNRDGVLQPYEDWRLPAARRADDLIGRMSLPEKAGMMMHAAHTGFQGPGGVVLRELAPPPPGALRSPVNVAGVPGFDRADKPSPYDLILQKNVRWISTSPGGTPGDTARWTNNLQEIAEGSRLGVPVMISADPVQTTNRMPGGALPPPDRKKLTSSWPDQIGLAVADDPILVERFGQIAGAEYRALGFRMVINPMADLATEPRWNRIAGTFGEDANKAAVFVAAYVRGFQGDKLSPSSVLAVVKHFPGEGPVAGGMDPHQAYGRFQVYPAGMLDYHLVPFRAGIAAGAAAVMPSYGIPQGVDTVGMSFSRKIVTGLLRQRLKFRGIVLSDWLHAMPWGVESLDKAQRERRMIEAGVDQFGGEHEPAYLIALVRDGQVSERRLDQSLRRILPPMFELGMFENPYVDAAAADAIVNSPEFRAVAEAAQRRAIVVLKNQAGVLPLAPGAKLFLAGFNQPPAAFAARGVASAAQADVVIVKVNAPYVLHQGADAFFKGTHEGPLVYAGADNAGDLDAIRSAAATGKPVVVVMSMERPAVLSEFLGDVSAMVATFGSDDAAAADILTGAARPTGKLPFDLPADMAAVEQQKEDAPHDFARVLFKSGFGLTYPDISKASNR